MLQSSVPSSDRDFRRKTTKSETTLTLKNQLFSKMIELGRETGTIVFLVKNKNFDVASPPPGGRTTDHVG